MSSSRPLRSSISPFRSRKSPAPAPPPPSSTSAAHSKRSATTSFRPPTSSTKPPVSPTTANQSTPLSFVDRTSDSSKSKENVTVTVRFRPLSGREISKGNEIAWYADGDNTVRNEFNPNVAYSFDRVFGPATTTRHVYDVAAQHVVGGAMEGINGTVFAYGVTSSGKTHTMHGEQKSPGIIPLAVKDVFGIIQETPGREFLLRVSYLEIYNEVINDLLDPTGQNLRVREDAQGTYVEGIKEEVVLSPAHALSLIASGEEHRHVGSNNFNLLSSRSHTIFTLTIESSPRGENHEEEVTLSQLHLIDLAGSESSKTETTGLRRKEGSYINKSLLTLGTVISKLTDGKSTHIPYRDSKLTRLLQSSLSGHGRASLICTVTPASSYTEETHNTLKFAHRSKHVEIKAFQNKILDEKSLIKKYQKEISFLKEELQQLRRGMMEHNVTGPSQEDIVNLKLQLEAGQVKLQSRLEEEEQAKAALMGRIHRLTKLILVSTKSTIQQSARQKPNNRRRHSFGEDELAYLPDGKRDYMIDDDAVSIDCEVSAEGRNGITNLEELVNDYKRNSRRGMLSWLKLKEFSTASILSVRANVPYQFPSYSIKKPEQAAGSSPSADHKSWTSSSPASSSKSSQNRVTFSDMKEGDRKSVSRRGGHVSGVDFLSERTQAGELFSAAVGPRHLPSTGSTITDQMDLLQEQGKMLAGEIALCTSSLKRLSDQAAKNPEDMQIQDHIQKLKDGIKEKKIQMRKLEQRMIGSVEMNPQLNTVEISQALSKLASQLNEKTFELEIKSADNRVLQEQLQIKTSENAEMQETILQLRQQLQSLISDRSLRVSLPDSDKITTVSATCSERSLDVKNIKIDGMRSLEEVLAEENTPTSVMSLNRVFTYEDSKESHGDASLSTHLLMQAAEIESLKREKVKVAEEKDGLEIHNQKLSEEASYAKELAAAAAVELRNLAGEVTKLSYQNAKLTADLAALKEMSSRTNICHRPGSDIRQNNFNDGRPDEYFRKVEDCLTIEELEQELNARKQREASLVAALSERDKIEAELRKRLDEASRHEADLENEIANMWVVSKMQRSGQSAEDNSHVTSSVSQTTYTNGISSKSANLRMKFHENGTYESIDEPDILEELEAHYNREKTRCKELEVLVSRLKGDDIGDLDTHALEELQKLHVEAITKICHAKCLYNIL